MKKNFYSACILTTLASLSLSACQTSPSELWPESLSDNSGQRPSQQKMILPAPKPANTSTTVHKSTSSGTVVSKTGVVLPPTYYLAEGTPVSHQTSDTDWVEKQNSTGYTIELASNDNAPSVAQTLQKAPKNARMAQVQYNDNGKTGYMGVYGSYATKEEADAALAKLPANLQAAAKVESWSNVQGKTMPTYSSSNGPSIAPPDVTTMSQ